MKTVHSLKDIMKMLFKKLKKVTEQHARKQDGGQASEFTNSIRPNERIYNIYLNLF